MGNFFPSYWRVTQRAFIAKIVIISNKITLFCFHTCFMLHNGFPASQYCTGVTEMDGIPHSVKILEQPMEFGYRFRYVVEGKAHGGLQGNSTKAGGKRGSKVFPEIQV